MTLLSGRFIRLLAVGPLIAFLPSAALAAGDCCTPSGTPGCDDPSCQAAVCAQDPFCCTFAWDFLCVSKAIDLCGCNGGEPPTPCQTSTNDCFVPGPGPGCNDTLCCEAICTADPFCCTTTWDALCSNAAVDQCELGGPIETCPPASNPCIIATNAPGCADATCCVEVCNVDPSCCLIGWDTNCVQTALGLCGLAPSCGTSTNDCFVAGTGPGCSDELCCQTICALAPSCCTVSWDQFCASNADLICEGGPPDPPSGCGVAENSCFVDGPVAGCNDAECCALVCATDAFCCNVQWDLLCVNGALLLCDADEPFEDCPVATNSCTVASNEPGCVDPDCCNQVCAFLPDCCLVAWDANCAATATTVCTPPTPDACESATNDCFTPSGTPGCADALCCAAICSADTFCCDFVWDGLCVSAAQLACEGGQPHTPEDCGTSSNDCFTIGGPGCSDAECCEFICAQDPFCCNVQWDNLCVIAAEEVCVPTQPLQSVCGPTNHSCVTPGSAGCADATCCAMVCSYATECCDIAWDAMCVELALRGCAAVVPGDLNGDGAINGIDLGILLAAWGPCTSCVEDLDGNGNVDAADLAILLSIWSE